MTEKLAGRLAGKKAVVTGASAGIGEATARALAAEGAAVTLVARREERLRALSAELPKSSVIALDVRDESAVREALGNLDCDLLLNNAGLSLGVDKLHEGDPEEWSTMIDTNVKGFLHVYRAIAPAMIRRGSGDIVTLGSVAGRQVYPGGNVYCATKHAVRALYEGMRLDAAGSGVRFTTVDPGMVETDFSRVRFRGDEARAQAVYEGMDPLRPEDIADCILFAVTRPANVNIGEIVLWASAQASTTICERRST